MQIAIGKKYVHVFNKNARAHQCRIPSAKVVYTFGFVHVILSHGLVHLENPAFGENLGKLGQLQLCWHLFTPTKITTPKLRRVKIILICAGYPTKTTLIHSWLTIVTAGSTCLVFQDWIKTPENMETPSNATKVPTRVNSVRTPYSTISRLPSLRHGSEERQNDGLVPKMSENSSWL